MEITSIKVTKVDKEDSRVKGFVNITIDDCLAVKDIRIIEGSKGLFVAMPNRKNKEGVYYDIVHPINQDGRTKLEEKIIEAYNNAE